MQIRKSKAKRILKPCAQGQTELRSEFGFIDCTDGPHVSEPHCFSRICSSSSVWSTEDKWSGVDWSRACFQAQNIQITQRREGWAPGLSWCTEGHWHGDPPISASTFSSQPEHRGGTPDPALCDPRGERRISLVGCARLVSSMASREPAEEERQCEFL